MNELDRAVAAFVGDDASDPVDAWPGGPSDFAPQVFARLARYLMAARAVADLCTPDARAALAAERLEARVRAHAQRRRQPASKRSHKTTEESST